MRRDLIRDIEEVGYIWGEIERWPRIGDVGGLLLAAYVLVGCKGLSKYSQRGVLVIVAHRNVLSYEVYIYKT